MINNLRFHTSRGAVWTTLNGYEFPRWFAPSPKLAIPEHSFRRTAHMEFVESEVKTTRNAAGFIEMSPMTKFMVQGTGAAKWLDWIMANRLPKIGRIALSVACNPQGGIDAEYTVVRLGENIFYLVSTPNGQVYNRDQLTRLLPDDGLVEIRDVSEQMGVIALAGPNSRAILQPLTDNDLSNRAFPWMSAQMGEVGYARNVHLLRLSYTGELGWELHHPIGYNRHLVDLLLKAGVAPFGLEALESMRLEKSYRAINRELCRDITPFEAGLDRFVRMEKGDFIGRDALQKQRDAGDHKVLVTLKLPFGETSVLAHESVYAGGELIGRITSGGYSYFCGHDIALALVPQQFSEKGTELQVNVSGAMRNAEVVETCLYDPTSARARS